VYKCVCSTALPGTEQIAAHAICVNACKRVLRSALLPWHLSSVRIRTPCMVELGAHRRSTPTPAPPWLQPHEPPNARARLPQASTCRRGHYKGVNEIIVFEKDDGHYDVSTP
jgi:hypothetical protein